MNKEKYLLKASFIFEINMVIFQLGIKDAVFFPYQSSSDAFHGSAVLTFGRYNLGRFFSLIIDIIKLCKTDSGF